MQPPLSGNLFFLKNLFCVFKDTRVKGLRRFKIFLAVSLVNVYTFTFRVSGKQFTYQVNNLRSRSRLCLRGAVRAVRCVRCASVRCGARCLRCLPACVRCHVHALRCPTQKRQKFRGARRNLHPPPAEKKSFPERGSPRRAAIVPEHYYHLIFFYIFVL